MENYKEKYEQALNRAKIINPGTADYEVAVKIFPELKESEDEKIRKDIIKVFTGEIGFTTKEEAKKYIAWLEKQGEQNLPDNVKSKFKVGDWVVQGKMLYQIEKVTNLPDNHFQYWTTDGVWFDDGTEAHLWTIQDAKDGDVLANENMVLIFKRFEEPSYRQHIIAHIGLDTCGYIQITDDSWNLGLNGANPATNEQRDLLFQKMKEAGYEWDAEKKELKKIELIENKDIELTDFEAALFSAFSDAWQQYLHGEEVDVEQWAKEHSSDLLKVARQEPVEWSEEVFKYNELK